MKLIEQDQLSWFEMNWWITEWFLIFDAWIWKVKTFHCWKLHFLNVIEIYHNVWKVVMKIFNSTINSFLLRKLLFKVIVECSFGVINHSFHHCFIWQFSFWWLSLNVFFKIVSFISHTFDAHFHFFVFVFSIFRAQNSKTDLFIKHFWFVFE